MFEIVSKQILSKDIKRLDVKAPDLVKNFYPGQFAIVMPDKYSRRIVIPNIDVDPIKQTLSLTVRQEDPSTERLGDCKIGDSLYSCLGPLGNSLHLPQKSTVMIVGESDMVAGILSMCRDLKHKGHKVIALIGFKKKSDIIFETQLRVNTNKLTLMTEDGSYEVKGVLIDWFGDILKRLKPNIVYINASVEQQEKLAKITRAKRVRTFINIMNPLSKNQMLSDESIVYVNQKRWMLKNIPSIWDGHSFDYRYFQQYLKSLETYQSCQQNLQVEIEKDSFKFFPKFLAGLVKEKH